MKVWDAMKIEYDIPIPDPRGGRRIVHWEEFDRPTASVFFTVPKGRDRQKYANALAASALSYGKRRSPRQKFAVRLVTENKVEGVRVWRTE